MKLSNEIYLHVHNIIHIFCEENILNLFFSPTKYSTLSQTTMTIILFSDSPITVKLRGPEFVYLHSSLHAKPMAVTIYLSSFCP